MTKSRQQWFMIFTIGFIILLLAAHVPFLTADPDVKISYSRDAFTDEGLNTIQVRNLVNHGYLSLTECDNLLKNPLFEFTLYLPFKIFGTHLLTARLPLLLIFFLLLFIIASKKQWRLWVLLLSVISLSQYQVFQFSHFSMAEIPAITCILASIFSYHQYRTTPDGKPRRKYLIWSAVFLSLAYYIKIQFIYIIFLLPLLMFIDWLMARKNVVSRKTQDASRWPLAVSRQPSAASMESQSSHTPTILHSHSLNVSLSHTLPLLLSVLLAFLLVYFFAWFLPHRESYLYMLQNQSGTFQLSAKTPEYIEFNLQYYFLKGWFQVFTYTFIASIIAGIIHLVKRKGTHFQVLFLASLIWFILELHKLAMVYLPTRYLISLYMSMGMVMATVIAEVLTLKPLAGGQGPVAGDSGQGAGSEERGAKSIEHRAEGKWRGVGSTGQWIRLLQFGFILMVLILVGVNVVEYANTLQRRTFMIRETNEYLERYDLKDKTIIGAWAPSLTWDSKARAIPVWNHFLNYKDPINTFHPRIVISEPDEKESEEAYRSQGIDLEALADSSRTVHIGQWDVRLYWIR